MIRSASDRPDPVGDLRKAFDQSFAEAPDPGATQTEDFLAIRVAGDPYALRLKELSGLTSARAIVPLPSRRADLLGVSGVRGSLVSVYSMAALLGYGSIAAPTPWLALCRADNLVAFAFELLDGFHRVARTDLYGADRVDPSAAGVVDASCLIRIGKTIHRVVDLRRAMAALAGAGTAGAAKEL
jgi:chemotaxis signal transduction protein